MAHEARERHPRAPYPGRENEYPPVSQQAESKGERKRKIKGIKSRVELSL